MERAVQFVTVKKQSKREFMNCGISLLLSFLFRHQLEGEIKINLSNLISTIIIRIPLPPLYINKIYA